MTRCAQSIMLSCIIYGRHLWLVERFQRGCVRTILNGHCDIFITNTVLAMMSPSFNIESTPQKHSCTGQATYRRLEQSTSKPYCSDELASSQRIRDSLGRKHRNYLKISVTNWGSQADDSRIWCCIIFLMELMKSTRGYGMEEIGL